MNYISAEEALQAIKPNQRIFVHGGAATPHFLLKKLADRASTLWNVEIVSISLQGDPVIADKNYKDSFRINSLFVSENVREAVNDGRGDYVPIFLSEIPILFRRGILPLDVAIVQVSPPDKHGYCSLGTSVDIAVSAVKAAKHVIAQVNPRMPRTLGDGLIKITDFDATVYAEEELPEVICSEPTELSMRIAAHCAELVENGATIQMGIGSIPDAVLASLTNHKELGVHTEMVSDGIIPLIEKGIITNQHKKNIEEKQ